MKKEIYLSFTVVLFFLSSCYKEPFQDIFPQATQALDLSVVVPQFSKLYGGTNIEIPHPIIVTPDGGYIMAGLASSNDGDVSGFRGNTDAWTVKLNGSGSIVWQKTLGGTCFDVPNSVTITADGVTS